MKVLCISHGSSSHINACLKIISTLEKSGAEVVLCSSPLAEKHLKSLKITYITVSGMPFGAGFESFLTNSYSSELMMRKNDYLYKKRQKGLADILERIKPDMILLDILYFSDFIIMYKWLIQRKCRLIFFTTKPSLSKTLSTPPINSERIPESNYQVKWLWLKYNSKKYLKRFIDFFKYFFYDDVSILKGKMKKNRQLSTKYDLVFKDFVGYKISKIPELVLLPEAYEFKPFQPNSNQYYIGFQFKERNEGIESNEPFSRILSLIESKKRKGSLIVYCSFGSIYGLHEKKVINFVRRLITAVRNLPEICVILSLKKEMQVKLNIDISKNLFVFDFVPQLAVLARSDMFITHGGINSIKEAIYYEVPMLVYPVNIKWDQPGNSARVVHHEMGLRGNMKSDSAIDIKQKVEEILRKNDFYRNNVIQMKAMDEKYTDEFFLSTFNRLIHQKQTHVT